MIGIENTMLERKVALKKRYFRHGRTFYLRRRCHTIKKDTTDNAVAYATNKTMPAAVMDNLELI